MFVFHFINHLDHFDNLVGQSLNQDMAVDVERHLTIFRGYLLYWGQLNSHYYMYYV
jgi:hypothetical protein